MRRFSMSQAGVGVTAPVTLDVGSSCERATIVFWPTGTIDATLEYTLDSVSGSVPADDRWVAHSKLTNKTVKSIGTLIGVVNAVRLRNAGAGTVDATVLQGNL